MRVSVLDRRDAGDLRDGDDVPRHPHLRPLPSGITAVADVPAVTADDLALPLLHALPAPLADVRPLGTGRLADLLVRSSHGVTLAPTAAPSQRRICRTLAPWQAPLASSCSLPPTSAASVPRS